MSGSGAAAFGARAPHVRSAADLRATMRCVVVAAVPPLGVAAWQVGYQAHAAVAAGATPASSWQVRTFALLAGSRSPDDPWSCFLFGALHLGPLLAAVFATGAFWEHLFARAQGRPTADAARPAIALLFTLCLPPTLPLWMAALGSSFGFVIGKEVFGGLGRNVVNPALAGLAFIYLAYPAALSGDAVWIAADGVSGATPLGVAARGGLGGLAEAGYGWWAMLLGTVPGAMGETSALACLAGAAILVYTRVASCRILAGAALGLLLGLLGLRALGASHPVLELPWHWQAVTGGFAFGVVYLATDPVTAAATRAGRWIYGLLIGVVVVVVRAANPAHREGVLLAILLGNVSAPLIDQVVARVQLWHGHRVR